MTISVWRVILGIVALALAVCQVRADVSAFALDQEYHYEYKGRAATGVADEVTQFSVLGFIGQVKIQNQGNYVYFEFEDIKFGNANQRFEEELRDELEIPYSEPHGVAAEYVKQLEKPFRAIFEQGLVKSFDAQEDDPEWSINWKRAFLSLFQTNFDNVNPVKFPKSNYLKHDEEKNVLRVMEDGVGGECETVYEFSHQPHHNNLHAKVLNVTKHRLYDKCTHRPHYFFSSMYGYECTHCDHEHEYPVQAHGRVEYLISGDRDHFTIDRIYGTGYVGFEPFEHGETVISGVNQTVFLHQSGPIDKPIVILPGFVTYKSLSYTFHHEHRKMEDVDLYKAHYYNRVYDYQYKNHREDAGKLLTSFVSQHQDHTGMAEERELTDHLVELVGYMTAFSYEDFNKFYTKFGDFDEKSDPKHRAMRTTLLQVIPLIGTNPSIMFIKYLIESKKVTGYEASTLVQQIHIYVKEPSEKLVNEYFHFIEKDVVKDHRELHMSAWLSFGSLVFKSCVHSIFNPHPSTAATYIRADVCSKYVQEIERQYNMAKNNYEKTIYLKALANTRLEETFPFFKNLVEHSDITVIRHNAIWALLEHLPNMREEILEIVGPLFHNYTEDYVMRLHAFEIILYTEPRVEYLTAIMDSLSHEPSQQVISYVYSSFVTIANTTDPCYAKLSKHIEHILPHYDEVEYDGLHFSRNKIFSYYNEKHHFGRSTHMSWIGSNTSILPREFYAGQSINVFGYNFDVVEFGYWHHGLEQITEKFFGPDGLYAPYDQSRSVLDIFHRVQRSTDNVEKERKEIKDSLHIQYREPQDIEGEVYFKLFNQDIRFSYFEESQFKSFLENGHFPIKDYTRFLKEGLPVYLRKIGFTDVVYQIPNELGLPVTMDLKIPGVFTLTGEFKAEVIPGFFSEDRNHAKQTNLHVSTDLHTAFDISKEVNVFVTVPSLDHYGYGLSTSGVVKFPVKGSLDYDFSTKKLTVDYEPSKETYDLVHFKSHPYTFVESEVSDEIAFRADKIEEMVDIHYEEHPTERHYWFGHDYFGVGLHFNSTYDYYWNDFGSYKSFIKSFFKKSVAYDDYFYWIDRYYAGTKGLVDYAFLNPMKQPFETTVEFQPSPSHPTHEFHYVVDFDCVKPEKEPMGEAKDDNIVDASEEKKTYVVHFDLVGKGPIERKWSAELNLSYTKHEAVYRKIVFNFDRTALPNYDSNAFKICYRGSATYPNFPTILDGDVDAMKAEFDANLYFGRDCTNDKHISLRAVVDKSEEQRHMMEHKEHLPYFYHTCEEQRKEGRMYSHDCWQMILDHARVDHLTMDIEYKNLPDYFKNHTYHLASWFRHYFYDNLEVNPFGVANPEHHIKIVANISYEDPIADIKIYKPTENVFFHKVFIPAVFPRFEPYSVKQNFVQKNMAKLFQYKHKPMCFLTGDYIYTFDNVSYHVPLTDCYHVAAKDCSKDEKFSVMFRAVKHDTYTKALKVFYGNHKIEILPIGDALVVRVDGVKQPVTEFQKYVHYDPEHKDQVHFEIYRHYNKYVVESYREGVRVYFDGKHSKIVVSNYYRGKQCGLCGDFNGEYYEDFVGPDHCVYHDEVAFSHSYAIPEDTCTVPEFENPCHINKKYDCEMKRNIRTYMGKGEGSRKICFSTAAFTECKPGCKPTGHERRQAGFHCLKYNDEATRALAKEARTRELTELRNKEEDHVEEVEVPEHCIPYHI